MTLSPNTDYNICIERLTDSDEQAGCLWVFALLKKDASICSHITDEQLNHNCSVDVKEKEERRLWEINSGLY